MPSAAALLFSALLALLAVPGIGTSICRAASPPPPCEQPDSTCERLPWVEQVMSARDRGAIPYLRNVAAEDPHDRVRERSVGALVILRDAESKPLFIGRLSSDPSPAVRRAAAEGIGLLNLQVPLNTLTTPLRKDPDSLVRAECARAIGRTGRADAAAMIALSVMDDPSPEVRALSAEAIATLKTEWGAEILKQAAQDKSPIVRLYVIRGLADSSPNSAVPLFLEVRESSTDPEARIEAFRGLLRSGDSARWTEAGLSDPDERIRFLSLREWINANMKNQRFESTNKSPWVRKVEPFLSDSSRGIRELAKGYLESLGLSVRPSGFYYVIQE